MKLNGNTILITGGASGIGLELTRQLVKLGNTVIVTGRDSAKLKKAKVEIPAITTYESDVSHPTEIAKLFEKINSQFPKLNILINNAGVMKTINLNVSETELEDVSREITTNLNGPIWMVQKFLPLLKKQAESAIVNVTSGLAFVPLPTSPVYCATKAGLHSYTLSLRAQLSKSSVKVFELAPPATATDLLKSSDAEDMKGITVMPVSAMVAAAIKGMEKNHFEIRPGQSNQLKLMSRVAPEFILKQMSRPVARMLAGSN
jgi:uncharacterized oxidoreductase